MSMPHVVVTKAWSNDAYCQKIFNFAKMMTDSGHEVFLYAAEGSDAPCTEFVPVISRQEQLELIGVAGSGDNLKGVFDPDLSYWGLVNVRSAEAISARRQERDFLCLIAGRAQKPVADALPGMMAVEYGVGYAGTFADYRVFESVAWQHAVYGAQDPANVMATRGHFYDVVIPNYYDLADFPEVTEPDDYYLFVGRLTPLKGLEVAQEVCQRLGERLLVAGQGEFSGYGEYVGVLGIQERNKLMNRAKALFAPTLYLEPFGGVHVEAMLCGTPVITTPWGGFTETFTDGVHGFRCHLLADFVQAALAVKDLNRAAIQDYAWRRFSLDAVGPQYLTYFRRLLTLYDAGWYETAGGL